MKIRVIDFFCGCGGTSLGLRQAGMSIVAGIDWDYDAGQTFKSLFPRATFLLRDIREMQTEDIAHLVRRCGKAPLLFSCCAPCQPFSRQNGTRRRGDHRKYLLEDLVPFVRRYRPDFVLCENVPDMRKFSGSRGPFSALRRALKDLRYSTAWGTVDSQDYGVPQRRRRLVLLASLRGAVDLPTATHGPGKARSFSTAWEWIADLPRLKAGGSDPHDPVHRAARLSMLNMERLRATPPEGSRSDWPERLVLECHRDRRGHSDVYGRVRKDQPASAMTTRCIVLSSGRFGHPVQHRALSAREAACLQTFPRHVVFHGSLGSMARQVGNAVPVLLARSLGRQFVSAARHGGRP